MKIKLLYFFFFLLWNSIQLSSQDCPSLDMQQSNPWKLQFNFDDSLSSCLDYNELVRLGDITLEKSYCSNGGLIYTNTSGIAFKMESILLNFGSGYCGYGRQSMNFLSFYGQAKNDKVVIRWTTPYEINNKGFIIENSYNQNDWNSVGFLEGHGTINEEKEYEFTLNFPKSNSNYFRLKQLDLDGTYQYSNLISVPYVTFVPRIFAIPNPASDYIHVQTNLQGRIQIMLLNEMGQKLNFLQFMKPKFRLDLSSYQPGIYFLKIKNADEVFIKKIIKK